MNETIIKIAHVESVIDDADGMRIKARLSQDGNVSTKDLPYAFPLLPKVFQSVPKVGEAVFIITAKLSNTAEGRYYIGPIISQPQFHQKDEYMYGRGMATSLLPSKSREPLERISNYASTDGAFPDLEDVALVGRKSEDVILKEGEVDIRCGIRTSSNSEDNLLGNVVFNRLSPSYIQLKFQHNICNKSKQEADSVINVVADKINLISHKDKNQFNLTDQQSLIKPEELDDIMSKLHQIPYGDILVEVLEKMRNAIVLHTHTYVGVPPCKDSNILQIEEENLNSMLSDHIRTS